MWVQELPTCHSIFGCRIMEKISRPLKPNVCKGVVNNRSAFVALELGHALGLNHTYTQACSMYYYQTFAEVRRTLCADERAAIRGIYRT